MSIPKTMKAIVYNGENSVLKEGVAVPQMTHGDDILIKTKAVASNPTDWKHVVYKICPPGCIVGCDVAGEIVAVGPDVDSSKFKVGDNVTAFVHGCSIAHPDNGAFAEYCVGSAKFSIKIDNCTSVGDEVRIKAGSKINTFQTAASLPVSLFTASMVSCWNFHNRVGFEIDSSAPFQNDCALFIWGGATAFGQNMIQVARLTRAYSKIVVVASKKHETLLKSFGADELFDYHDEDVLEQIVAKYPNLTHLIDAVSLPETLAQTYQVASKTQDAQVVNLMNFTIDAIPKDIQRSNVSVGGVFLYSITGKDVPMGQSVVPKDLKFSKMAAEVIPKLQKPINDGRIRSIAIKNHQHLGSVPGVMDAVQHGKNSGEKLVVTL